MSKMLEYKLSTPKKISFWTFQKAKNCFASIFSSYMRFNLKEKRKFYSRNQIVGIIYHEIMEEFYKGQIQLEEYDSFLQVLSKIKSRYLDKFSFESSKEIDEWSEVEGVFDYLCNMEANNTKDKQSDYIFEKEIYSRDEKLFGKPDLIIKEGERIILYEFKSGRIRAEDGSLKIEYVNQVHFYSFLIKENYGKYPDAIYLSSMKEEKAKVLLNENLVDEIVITGNKYIEKIETKFSNVSELSKLSDDYFNPSLDVCKFCKLRCFCPSFKKLNKDSEEIHVVKGLLVKEWFDQSLKFTEISIESITNVTIRNFPSALLKNVNLSESTYLVCTDLKKVSDDIFEFNYWSEVQIYD